MTEVEIIAARYGAKARPGLQIQRVASGVSGLPALAWVPKLGLVYAVKQAPSHMDFGGAPPQPCEYRGEQYPSMTAAAKAHGVSVAAVSKAVKKHRQDAASTYRRAA